jgi:hypothetical protein
MADPAVVQGLIDQVANLQAQLDAQAQVQPSVQAPVPVGPFALTPARANQDVINLTKTNGIKLYKAITMPLEIKFDGSSNKLLQFLDDVRQKASNYGWNNALLSISDQDAVNPQNHNLLHHHHMLSSENICAHASYYVQTQTRLAQDSLMMYEFLRDSLTSRARARLSTDAGKYLVNGTEDGPCYLKNLLNKFYVKTRATNFHLRQKLQNFPTMITELKFDIAAFNDLVRELVQDLAAGGETSSDLIVYVFNSYLKAKDTAFIRYIECKKEAYDDGSEDISVETLMDLALIKFNQLKQAKVWKAKSPKQEQVFALIAELKQAQNKFTAVPNGQKGNSRAIPRKVTSPRDPPKMARTRARLVPRRNPICLSGATSVKVTRPPRLRMEKRGTGATSMHIGVSTRLRIAAPRRKWNRRAPMTKL